MTRISSGVDVDTDLELDFVTLFRPASLLATAEASHDVLRDRAALLCVGEDRTQIADNPLNHRGAAKDFQVFFADARSVWRPERSEAYGKTLLIFANELAMKSALCGSLLAVRN